ncbi:MAG: SH3 domain-containing protein [Lachnospiraceae bacterium]
MILMQTNARRMREKGNRRFVLLLFIITGVIGSVFIATQVMSQQVYGYTAVKGTVLCKSGMVRQDASTASAFAFGVTKDEIVMITDEKIGSDGKVWYQVTLSGSTGYIRSDLVQKSTTPAAANTTDSKVNTNTGTIKGTNVIVREEASKTSGIRTTLAGGQSVTVESSSAGTDGSTWYYVSFTKDGNSYKGYIRSDLVSTSGSVASSGAGTSSSTVKVLKGTVTANSIRVRKTAAATGTVMATLTKSASVTVAETVTGDDSQKWYKVTVPAALTGGTEVTGYIRADLLSVTETTVTQTTGATTGTGTSSTKKGTIKGNSVRIRASASTTAAVSGALNAGTEVTVLAAASGDGKNWYQIQFTYNGTTMTGYVSADYVTVTETAASSSAGTQIGTVKGSGINIRKEPVSGEILCKLNSGQAVTVTEQTKGNDGTTWYKISFTYQMTAQSGYIRSDFVEGVTMTSSASVSGNAASTTVTGDRNGAVKGINVNVRKEAVNGEVLCKLSTGHSVTVKSEKTGTDEKKWYQISYSYNNTASSGWIRSDYVTAEETPVQTAASTASTGSIKGMGVRIRESAVNGTVVVQLDFGHALKVLGETTGSDGYKWYQVSFTYQGSEKNGYVRSDLVTVITTSTQQAAVGSADFEASIAALPESYKNNLRALHEKYPNWKFEAVNTNLDWNTAVTAESSVGKNLVAKSSISSWKSTEPQAYDWTQNAWYGFDGGSWASASKELIQYYMDPRNFLDESGIFQFETLEYQGYQNEAGVLSILASTFMSGSYTDTDGATRSYASTFLEAGSASGISPYHLASRCLQEQGIYGTSQSVTGTVSGYENFFNFFNIGAYAANGNSSIINGLIYAQGTEEAYYRPWNSRYKSITGSAKYVSEKYVKKGQNTLYFQKFNVVNSENGIYSHQYMSNILAASAESARMKKAYSDLNTSLVFKIPYYNNMPETACAKPTSESNPNNYLSALWIDNQTFAPGFSPVVDNYYLIVDNSVGTINIGATPVADTSSVGGVGQVNLNVGTNVISIVCKAQNGNTKTYTLTVQRN